MPQLQLRKKKSSKTSYFNLFSYIQERREIRLYIIENTYAQFYRNYIYFLYY